MCEFNRPYPVPYGQHPDDRASMHRPIQVLPQSAWERREAQLPEDEVAMIHQAVQEAADTTDDVHLYRKIGSKFVGVAFLPGSGPNVKIWEH